MKTNPMHTCALTLLLLALPIFLSGCWDSRELNRLYVVTGMALDKSDTPDQIDVSVQIGNFSQKGSGKSDNGGEKSSKPTTILKTTCENVLSGINELNRDSNRSMLMQHNQVRLFGIELAQQGIEEHLDLFIRNPKSRPETPLLIVDGRAEDVLTAKLSQEPISGIFLGGMLTELSKVSVHYRIRMIDFLYSDLEKSSAPVIPIIKVKTEGSDDEEKQEIHLDGIAVFHDGKMIGRLDNEDTMGYLWALGDVKKSNIDVAEGENRATMHITSLENQHTVTLQPDGSVKVDLFLKGSLILGEMHGFTDMKPPELMPYLEKLAEKTFKDRVMHAFHSAQELKADIFDFGSEVYRKYPQQWSEMEDQWNSIFADLELNIKTDMRLPLPGQIMQSLEMEKGME
jgi:spore germination protein KC